MWKKNTNNQNNSLLIPDITQKLRKVKERQILYIFICLFKYSNLKGRGRSKKKGKDGSTFYKMS